MTDELPPAARPVWVAYETMTRTKQAHIDHLRALEEQQKSTGRPPTPGEKSRLAELLAEHDQAVSAFKSLLNQLRVSDPGAFGVVVSRLSEDAGGDGGGTY